MSELPMNQSLQSATSTSYERAEPFLVAVDCIIFSIIDGALKLLIFKREVKPLAGQWSLIGSFVENNEDVDAAAQRILFELTGLKNIYMEQLHCFGKAGRDSGGRVISIAYWSLIKLDQKNIQLNAENHEAKWVAIDQLPKLILDHTSMVNKAIERLRDRCKYQPIGFELLPKQFTLPMLLTVYEAIFDRKIDDRNFRKKIIKSGILINTGNKDMSTSKKGSYIYKFDPKQYKKSQKEGYNLNFKF